VTPVTVAQQGGATLASMVAAVWTAIGLLAATSLGRLFYLGARIDSLGNRVESAGDSLNGRIDALGDSLNGRIDALGARLDGRIDALGGRIDALEGRMDKRFDALETKLEAHIGRHAS
jgi:hypothetical protein